MVVKHLIEAYQSEFDAIIDYTAYWYNGNSPVFEEVIRDECDHARKLALRIVELGELVPCYWTKSKDTPSRDAQENYKDAFEDEIKAIKMYKAIALMTKSTDPRTYSLVQQILADEEEHADIFKRFLI